MFHKWQKFHRGDKVEVSNGFETLFGKSAVVVGSYADECYPAGDKKQKHDLTEYEVIFLKGNSGFAWVAESDMRLIARRRFDDPIEVLRSKK